MFINSKLLPVKEEWTEEEEEDGEEEFPHRDVALCETPDTPRLADKSSASESKSETEHFCYDLELEGDYSHARRLALPSRSGGGPPIRNDASSVHSDESEAAEPRASSLSFPISNERATGKGAEHSRHTLVDNWLDTHVAHHSFQGTAAYREHSVRTNTRFLLPDFPKVVANNVVPNQVTSNLPSTSPAEEEEEEEGLMESFVVALSRLLKGNMLGQQDMEAIGRLLNIIRAAQDTYGLAALQTTRLLSSLTQLGALDACEVPFGDELYVRARAREIVNFWKAKFNL